MRRFLTVLQGFPESGPQGCRAAISGRVGTPSTPPMPFEWIPAMGRTGASSGRVLLPVATISRPWGSTSFKAGNLSRPIGARYPTWRSSPNAWRLNSSEMPHSAGACVSSTPFPGAVRRPTSGSWVSWNRPWDCPARRSRLFSSPRRFPSPIQDGTARTLHVRSEGPAAALAPAIRDLVAQLDPRVPILELGTLDQTIRADILQQRMLARGAAILGIVALLLASVGLYGVTSYSVAMRWREIAVRMALGARPDRVLAMVFRQALAVAMIGAVLGGLAAIAAGLVIQAEVFGVAGVDIATLGGSAALLAAAMLLASILPARRAARLDPNAVLREE